MDAPANTFSAYILQHWNDFSSYFDSFSVILLLWATHRDIGAALPRFGGLLRRLNMACCMIAALIPFGMSLRETFPRDTVADLFAVGVVFLSSGALLCMPCLGRWLVRGPHRLPPIMLQVGEDEGEEDDGGDMGGARRSRGGAAGAATRSVMGLSAGGASDTRGVAHSLLPGSHVGAEPEEDTAYTPSRLEKQNSSGNDSYYGFLVEDDPAEDYKTDGRMVASAVQELRRSAGYAQPGSPVGSLPGTPGGSASQPLEVMAELAEEEATPPHHPQPAPEALFDDEEEEQEQEDGEPESAPSPRSQSQSALPRARDAGRAVGTGAGQQRRGVSSSVLLGRAGSASRSGRATSHRAARDVGGAGSASRSGRATSHRAARDVGGSARPPAGPSVAFQPREEAAGSRVEPARGTSGERSRQDLYAALLVSSRGSGGYSSNELPVEMEEHLVRLLVARAMVLPLMAAMCAATTPFVSILGLNPLLLAWPVVGLIGWAEHSIRSTRGEPWCITRFLLCWRGHPRAIPGVGSVYPMHQGPCSWMYRCRRLRAFLCCDPSQDMDDRAAVTSRVAVSTAARAYEHGKDELGDDDHTTSGPGWGAWGEDMPGLAQAVSRGSINGHRDAMVTELTASSLR
jgi:hypothetical protein